MPLTFKHYLVLNLGDEEAEIEATVTGTYDPGIPFRWGAEPPEPESFCISSIRVKGSDGAMHELPTWLFTDSQYEALCRLGVQEHHDAGAAAEERDYYARREREWAEGE
jgi:hypothetical protein